MSDCAAQSGKYKHIIYNELAPLVYKGFKMAINGDFEDECRWISREEFSALKTTDPYAAICFSFGNNCADYAYSSKNEKIKMLLHKICFSRTAYYTQKQLNELIKMICASLKETENANKLIDLRVFQRLQNLQGLQRLQRLQKLQGFDIECYNLSYEKVKIPPNSIIYCDIPYKNTSKYNISFDHDKFYAWAAEHKSIIYISEYQMPEGFTEVYSCDRICTLDKCKHTTEKLFINR